MYATGVDEVREFLRKEGRNKEALVTQGNVAFIPLNEEHQFENVDNGKVKFLCTMGPSNSSKL